MLGIAELSECFLALEPVEYLASNNRWQRVLIRAIEPARSGDFQQLRIHLIPFGVVAWNPGDPEITVTSMKDEKQGYSFPLLRRSENVTQESGK